MCLRVHEKKILTGPGEDDSRAHVLIRRTDGTMHDLHLNGKKGQAVSEEETPGFSTYQVACDRALTCCN